jgi:hypothetical protein
MDEPRARQPHEVDYGELPELTRALRALGSSRRASGTLQSQFFQPLLEARRKAAEARAVAPCIRAFDAGELERSLQKSIERILSEWPDHRPQARRALRAELSERVGEYSRALRTLSDRAAAVLGAHEDSQLEAWRGWTTQLAATFDAADRGWMALRSVIESLPPRDSGTLRRP